MQDMTIEKALQQHVNLGHITMRHLLSIMNKVDTSRMLSSMTEEEIDHLNILLVNPPSDNEDCESCSG